MKAKSEVRTETRIVSITLTLDLDEAKDLRKLLGDLSCDISGKVYHGLNAILGKGKREYES